MNLTQDHLETALTRNIITVEQRDALRELAHEPAERATVEQNSDERFRFITGFNDIFLAIGVILFIVAMSLVASQLFDLHFTGYLFVAATMWLISEILATRLRRAIPSMLAAGAFVVFALFATDSAIDRFSGSSGVFSDDVMQLYGLSIAACIWTLAYFYRFRLPFSVIMIGGAFVSLGFLITMSVFAGISTGSTLFDRPLVPAIYALVSGLILLAIALRYDRADPERVSLKADYGFWLHLLAAPLIVHAMMYLVAGLSSVSVESVISVGSAIRVVAIFLVLAVFALVINRRAILVATLTYLGIALWYLISRNAGTADNAVLLTMLIISLFVIGLGIGWHPIRRTLMRVPPLNCIGHSFLSKQV